MRQSDQDMHAEAIGWVIRLRDPAHADWEGFTAWLDADPAHNHAYDRVAMADRAIEEAFIMGAAAPAPSNDNQPGVGILRRHPRWFAAATAAAAALLGIVAYPTLSPVTDSYAIETRAGEHRMATLDDGTRIDLNGDTRISLRKGNPRFAALDRGEAVFTVVHDPKDPFVVEVGDAHLQDVGTTFNVLRTSDRIEASVSQGTVLYNPGAEALRLDAGKLLQISHGAARVSQVDPATVAGWRDHRLAYRDATLSTVTADLARNLGVTVTVSPDVADRRFSGVIYLDRDPATVLSRVAALLDLGVSSQGKGWRLSAKSRG